MCNAYRLGTALLAILITTLGGCRADTEAGDRLGALYSAVHAVDKPDTPPGAATLPGVAPLPGRDQANALAADRPAGGPPRDGHGYGIEGLIAKAMRDNPSLRIKSAKADAAQTQVQSAKWQFLATPSVSVEDAFTQNDPSMRGDESVTVLRLQQPLWTGGRLTSNLRRAKAGVEVSRADLDHERQGVALSILERYGQWLSALLKRQAMQDCEALYAELSDQIARRIEAGASAQSDMIMLKSRVDQLRVSINTMESQEQTSLAALSQLIGGPVTAGELARETNGPAIDAADGPAMIARAKAISPLLKRLTAEVKVADENIARARSGLSPEVFVRAERQYGNLYTKAEDPYDRVYIGVQSQFGAGFSTISDMQGAGYERDAAKLNIRSGELSLVEQMSTDLIVASSIDSRIQTLRDAVASTSQTKESWDRQFVAGRKSWLDVMNAVREHMDMKVQLAEAEATSVIVKWRLRILADGLDALAPDMKGERS